MLDNAAINTDIKLWQKEPGDYYSPSIHVTTNGGIGINVSGNVIVMPIEQWHFGGKLLLDFKKSPQWRRTLVSWLLR